MTNPTLTTGERSRSRWLEDFGFGAGVLVGIFAAVRETIGAGPDGFPWTLAVVMAALVAPKTLGRVTTGRVWSVISSRLGGGGSK